ncbi:MAG: VWA domain-containing protein, partial [Calditrichia bacterium]|nr:VWA domain-containing protein [Calditrichia bacterium]
MIEDLYLNFSIPAWIIFLISWLFIAIAFFFYTRTLPPLSNRRKTILIILRTINFIVLISLIFQPVLHYILQKRENPTLALLFDNSSSMKIAETYGQRGDSLQYILRRINSDWQIDSVIIRSYRFSQELQLLKQDSLDFAGTRTNIADALNSVRDSLLHYNIRSIILFSDGLFNEGANPLVNVKDSPVPISTITVGDTIPKKDIEISGLRYNPVVYAGDSITLSVNVSQTGFKPSNVLVRLRGASGQIAAKSLLLPPTGFQKSLEFEILPKEAGEFSYQVEVQSFSDEITARNNRRQFILRVLKSKHRILLVSGQPSFDQRILFHVLQQLPDVRVTVLSENRLGRFYEPNVRSVDPDSQDLFIYLGYPTVRSDKNFLNSMLSSIQKNNIPLLFMLNENSNLSNLKPVQDILPVNIKSRALPSNNAMVRLTATGLLHP